MKQMKFNTTTDSIQVEYLGEMVGSYSWTKAEEDYKNCIGNPHGDNVSKNGLIAWTDANTGERLVYPTTDDLFKFHLNDRFPRIPEDTDLEWNYNDGGRSNYYKAESVGDCVTRAISIASGKDYKVVYDMINKEEKNGRKRKGSARNGSYRRAYEKVIFALGGKWFPLISIGSGCTTHMRKGEIPMTGRIVLRLSRHLAAVIDGVLNDTYDSSRGGDRCVYGYYQF